MNRIDIRQFNVEYPEVIQDSINVYEYCFEGIGTLQVPRWNEYSYQTLYNVGQMIDFAMPVRCNNILPIEYVEEYMSNKDNILDPYVNLALLLLTPSYESQFHKQYYLDIPSLKQARNNINDFDIKEHKKEMSRLLPQAYLSILKLQIKERQLVYNYTPFIPHNIYAKPFVYNVTPRDQRFVDSSILLARLQKHLRFISDFIGTFEYPSGKVYSMVCGGFVLRCSHNNLYQDISKSDIDIFITGNEDAKRQHIQKMVDFLQAIEYRFSSIGPVITCVSREPDTLQVQIINSKFDNPVSILDYFDFSHIQMMYDGNRVLCTSKWYKYSPVGLTDINKHRIKQYRVSKAIERGFVPCFNENNSLGYNLSGTKSTGIYYNKEYVVSLPKNKVLINNNPEVDRTFNMAKDITIESSFIDVETYNVSISQKYKHVLEVTPDYVGKIYCHGHAISYNDFIQIDINDIMIPVKVQDVRAGLFNNKGYVLSYAKLHYKPANFEYVKKLIKRHNKLSYIEFFIETILSNSSELNILARIYNTNPTAETFEPLKKYIHTNYEQYISINTNKLIDYFRYVYPIRSDSSWIVSDGNFRWYLVNVSIECANNKHAYYEGNVIRKLSSYEKGIIFMIKDDEQYIIQKVIDNKPSFEYSS